MDSVLNVKNLSKTFGKKQVVSKVNLNVRAGEVMGFLGPNGAGKTTCIKMILGFLMPDEGEIIISGYDTTKNYEDAMALVGGIVENPDMYKNFTGRLNLELYARTHENVTKERIDEVVKMVGLENRIDEKVKKYSLGMKQRLGLAEAILHHPKLLLLDEPTNGLDPAGIKELRDILKTLAHEEGVAVLVSSHQLAEMQLMCDRVTIISAGTVLCEKTIEEMENYTTGEPIFKFRVDDNEKAAQAISEYYNEKGASVTIETADDGFMPVKTPEEDVPAIVAALVGNNVGIFEIKKESNTLEDAFIAITGGGNTIV